MPFTVSRHRMIVGALLCLLLVVLLTVVYKADVHQLDTVDNELGAGPQGWTYRHHGVQQLLFFVASAFSTLPAPRRATAIVRGPLGRIVTV